MEFRKMIIVLSITISVIISIMWGASYGWYAYANAETNIKGSTKKEAPTIIFAQSEYVYSRITIPILDKDKYTYANKNSFTITLDKNLSTYQTAIEISLKDIAMSNELKTSNYKYELLQDGNIVASGDFSNIGTSSTLNLQPLTVFTPATYPTTYNYELYIWLSDDGSNQNNLMNKVFTAKIAINSAIKK